MKRPPEYFDSVRSSAARRWDQLEQDPELAGPWHQLFRQVQSPAHVLSELLQNADDANATEASVRIDDHCFVFEHNGEDFREEEFASLCRFGYSNKRSLHTIGFRGVGFKSTFSLGDRVELFSPTLSVGFSRKRFTEPRWLRSSVETAGRTQVRVNIHDMAREEKLEKNLDEWLRSPVSLLFFRSLRRLAIYDHLLEWQALERGSVPGSQWMMLSEQGSAPLLLIRSPSRPFPPEALAEIKQERSLEVDHDTKFPPCALDIVLGARSFLFVVLPTSVETGLPFACNAPFIQDPARLKIKDPAISPTNRWLLKRAGELAGTAMLHWLDRRRMPIGERAAAYGLLPNVDRAKESLEVACGAHVEDSFASTVSGRPILLTDTGRLTLAKGSVIVADEIASVWPATQAAKLLDQRSRPALCQAISPADRAKLLKSDMVEQIGKKELLASLRRQCLPKPKTWRHLLRLWVYLASELTGWKSRNSRDVRIVPAQGNDVLHAAVDVVRLGDKRLLRSEADWSFLSDHVVVLNQNWPRFLGEERRTAITHNDGSTQGMVETALDVLKSLGLLEASDVDAVIARVAQTYFAREDVGLLECIRLAQIAAKLGATAGKAFRYRTRDEQLRSTGDNVIVDDGALDALLPAEVRQGQVLHDSYLAGYSSCTRDEWTSWIASGRAGLHTFVPIPEKWRSVRGKSEIKRVAHELGLKGDLTYPYVTDDFWLENWDFEEIYWEHWTTLAKSDNALWTRIADRILSLQDAYWNRAKNVRLLQTAMTGKNQSITDEPLPSSWVLRLRELPCLFDTHGIARKPNELLRRTPQTEPLLDVELFVATRLDTEKSRPLLDILGVGTVPPGPDRLLSNLRALAKSQLPPVHEVDKWYRRLDQMTNSCSTTDLEKIKEAFRTEKLILAEDGGWVTRSGVFLLPDDEEVPGIPLIRSAVKSLRLWKVVEVGERPSAPVATHWLGGLPSRAVLTHNDAQRAKALLSRYPVEVWQDCAHWLNLAGEWVPTRDLEYSLSMQSFIRWQHLHEWVKQKTADLQGLRGEVTTQPPFSSLVPLAQCIEEQVLGDPTTSGLPEQKDWLTTLGIVLREVEFDQEEETRRIRAIAERLSITYWQSTERLKTIPYLGGIPAGTPREVDVLWQAARLYVGLLPRAKLARRVPEEIGRSFARPDIKAALDYSIDRSPEEVREYLHGNFKLVSRTTIDEIGTDVARAEPSDVSDSVAAESGLTANDQRSRSTSTGEADRSRLPQEGKDGEPSLDLIDHDDQGPGHAADKVTQHTQRATKAVKPSVLARFAAMQGFRQQAEGLFVHRDGSAIVRTTEGSFPWERRTPSGQSVHFYWAKDHCLEREPLQLDAEVWWLIDKHPESHSLVLSNLAGRPIEISGSQLRAMNNRGEVTLHPSTYRLVYKNGLNA